MPGLISAHQRGRIRQWPRAHRCETPRAAKLTGAVNIAVFAASRFCVEHILLSNAAFKPVCRFRELDVSRYGRQKRQDPARSGNDVARWAAKTARMGGEMAASPRYPGRC